MLDICWPLGVPVGEPQQQWTLQEESTSSSSSASLTSLELTPIWLCCSRVVATSGHQHSVQQSIQKSDLLPQAQAALLQLKHIKQDQGGQDHYKEKVDNQDDKLED